MLKQQQSQKMMQKLSPQQIQLMKLLQVPTDMLEQRVQQELEGNPALEIDEHQNDEEEKEDPLEEEYLIGSEESEKKKRMMRNLMILILKII